MVIDTNTLIIVLSSLVLVLAGLVIHLEIKLKRVLRGKSCKDLGDSIVHLSNGIKNLENFQKESEAYFKNLEKRVRRSSQSVETIRFNAFRGDGTGGNQSFASAIINENGDGIVLSSIYSRERVSVFAKPLSKFSSTIELSEEENQALEGAINKLKERK